MTEENNGETSINGAHCGAQNSDQGQTCVSRGRLLAMVQASQRPAETRVSRLAITAFVLGILSIVGGLTGIPAIMVAIIARSVIGRSGGRLTGAGFAVIGMAIPVVVFAGIFLAALQRVGPVAKRMACREKLSEIGKAMLVYANDYDDALPRAGGPNAIWGTTVWSASTRALAYNDNGTTSEASISSCFYLLVKDGDVTPKSFVCSGDWGTSEFRLAYETCPPGFGLTDAWDFGSNPVRHCSYSYHLPFSGYALTLSGDPGLAVASDRNPWLDSPAAKAKMPAEFSEFIPDTDDFSGNKQTAVVGNAVTHEGKGQNVQWHCCVFLVVGA